MKRVTRFTALILGCLVLGSASPLLADDTLEGGVEVLYRNVKLDGSLQKYNEDFDGLSNGGRLANLFVNWQRDEGGLLDFARLDLNGLAGEPQEYSSLRLGRKDVYELDVSHRTQDYLYNLFNLYGDLDAHTWNAQRAFTDLNLRIFANEKTTVFFNFNEGQRTGESANMKDIQREVFTMVAPLDYNVKRYTGGVRFQVADVDFLVQHTVRRYDNNQLNTTENDAGLSGDFTASTLNVYDWNQQESGTANITTFRVDAPIGSRVNLQLAYQGNLIDDEKLSSNVRVNADGLDFTGAPFAFVNGFSDTEIAVDTGLLEADLSIAIANPVTLHVQYRSLNRDLQSDGFSALEGLTCTLSGNPCSSDADCDPTGFPGDVCEEPGVVDTSTDYEIDTLTGLVELRPHRRLSLTGGIRVTDRSLTRDGFGGERDDDWKSDGDESLVFSAAWRAAKWLRFNGSYEDSQIDQPLNAPSLFETERLRARATISPSDSLRFDLGYTDFQNNNDAPSFRDALTPLEHSFEGTSWSAAIWHQASERITYTARYALQDVDSRTGILFDTGAFGGPAAAEAGDSIFDNESEQISARIDYNSLGAWKAFAHFWRSEADGNNLFLGDNPAGFESDQVLDQTFDNIMCGVTYTFKSGIWFGGDFRDFDYEDANSLVDYDGQILQLRAGMRF